MIIEEDDDIETVLDEDALLAGTQDSHALRGGAASVAGDIFVGYTQPGKTKMINARQLQTYIHLITLITLTKHLNSKKVLLTGYS